MLVLFQRIDTTFKDDCWILEDVTYGKRRRRHLSWGGNDSSVPDYPSLAYPPEE